MTASDMERYVPQGELGTRAVEELEAVGLSANFPTRMKELNDGLIYWGAQHGSFSGLRFNLRPDETFPKVDVETRYISPYTVTVEAGTNKMAVLDIAAQLFQHVLLAMLGLHQVAAFTEAYPTNEPITLSATPRDPEKLYKGRKLPLVRAEPFAGMTSTEDLESLGIVPAHFNIHVGFTARTTELQLGMSYPDERRADEPVFMLHNFHARDTAANIEHVVGTVGALLTQNWNVPDGGYPA